MQKKLFLPNGKLRGIFKLLFIMKFALLILVLSSLQVYSKAFSQEKFDLSLQNAKMKHALSAIEHASNYRFIYNDDVLPEGTRVSISAKDMTLKQILDELFAHTPLVYKVLKNDLVAIGTKDQAFEAIQVNGKVVDSASGQPLTGVTIRIKGTTIGTTSGPNGEFSLEVPDDAVLEVSYLGYTSKEVSVNGRSNIQISLATTTTGLNQLVVIGYGTEQRKDLTGAIATVDEEALKSLPVSTVDQKLIGQVAGVQIQQLTGAPGGGTSVKIRGMGSLGAGNEPLYVIDGMPYSSQMNQRMNPLLFLNPNDIESITVLKDASSTAIYGSRGANGVIMITTKKGIAGQTRVNFSAKVGVQQVPQKGRPDLLNKREFAELQRDRIDILVRRIENREPVPTDYPIEYRDLDKLTGEGTDWYDLLLRDAMTQDYNISVLKGTENSKMNFSLGYYKQDGVVRYTGLKRYSAKLGIETNVGNTVKIGGSLQLAYVDQKRTHTNSSRNDVIGVSIWANPISTPYDENGNLKPYIESPQSKYQSAWSFANPLFVLRNTTQSENEFQNLGIAFIEWNIIPGLKARSSLSTIWSTSKYFQYVPSTVGGNNKPPTPGTGSSTSRRGRSFNWMFENTLTYNKTIGDHSFNAVLGYITQKSTSDGINLDAEPYGNDLIQTINAAQDISSWGQSINDWSMISYLGRINYSYKDRYLLTATFRSDGSSRFGFKNRYAFFPSFAAAWRISEEDFLKNSKTISSLKLRASYGKSGNNNIGNYAHLASISTGSYVFNNELASASHVGLSNPYLTWEESDQIDVGIDLKLFNNRASLVADYYYRKSTNMLLNDLIPAITGFNSQIVNKGSVQNTGVELALGGTPVTGAFSWNINLNMAINRNKVLSLNDNGDRILSGRNDGNPTHVSVVGKPIGQFFGYIFEGLYTAKDLEDPNVAKYPTVYVGASKYKDINGDGHINDLLDYTIIGNPHPDFTFGITNNFSYKRFNLNVIINGQYGGDVVNGLRQTVDNLQGFFNVSKEWVNRYRGPEHPGDGKHYGVPVVFPSYGHRMSTLWIEDASYLRIANLTLGYSLPGKLLGSAFIKNCNIYLTVQNLAMFTNYGGANPEAQDVDQDIVLNPGYDMTSYPLARTTAIGINLSF